MVTRGARERGVVEEGRGGQIYGDRDFILSAEYIVQYTDVINVISQCYSNNFNEI